MCVCERCSLFVLTWLPGRKDHVEAHLCALQVHSSLDWAGWQCKVQPGEQGEPFCKLRPIDQPPGESSGSITTKIAACSTHAFNDPTHRASGGEWHNVAYQ